MFEYIKLKNFKSFGDITFDLTDKNGKNTNNDKQNKSTIKEKGSAIK